MWSVASILAGLQSFFYEETATTGSVAASAGERRVLAAASLEHNARAPLFAKARQEGMKLPRFWPAFDALLPAPQLFPELIDEQRALRRAQQPDAPLPPPAPAAASLAPQPPPWLAPPEADGAGAGVAGGGNNAASAAAATASTWVARLAVLGGILAVLAVPLLALALQQQQQQG